MDPELRAFLEAMEQRLTEKVTAGDARAEAARRSTDAKMTAMDAKIDKTRETLEASIAATRETLEAKIAATRGALEAKIDESRREAGVMMEAIIHEIRALPEGLSTLQRQEPDRLDAAREEAMLNRHVLPLEASAVNHEQRITAVERHR